MSGPSRRALLRGAGILAAGALLPRRAVADEPAKPAPAAAAPALLARTIPSSGEALPAIGLGTWQAFDVGDGAEERTARREVLDIFLAGGGRVIDSSPMYGRAEAVIGELLAASGRAAEPFLATKVWTQGKQAGIDQMERSLARMGGGRIDLLQVHNLVDWRTHLPTLRAWKKAGRIRYVGVTHWQRDAFADLETIVRKQHVDFVQLPYSIAYRAAEKRLLPAAADAGVAVLVMRPFEGGDLFGRVRGRPLPGWAAELGCTSWAQVFLKFLLGHPAVTCPIPATSKAAHMRDNLAAGVGPLPDAKLRDVMARTAAE